MAPRAMTSHPRMVGLALLGVGAITVGCGSPQPAASLAATASVMVRTPEYESDGRALVSAREVLVGRCMTGRGFAYHVGPLPPPPPPVAMPPGAGGYGLFEGMSAVDPTTLAWLRTPALAPQALYVEGLGTRERAAYDRALNGSPRTVASLKVDGGAAITYQTDGCHARSTAHLHGSLRAYHRLGDEQNLAGVRFAERLSTDVGFVQATDQWRSCMADRGVASPSPEAARDAVYDAYVHASDPASVRPQELATAAADRDCAGTSQVYAERARAQQVALTSLPAESVRSMTRLAHQRSAAADRARAILAAS